MLRKLDHSPELCLSIAKLDLSSDLQILAGRYHSHVVSQSASSLKSNKAFKLGNPSITDPGMYVKINRS